MYVSFKCYGGQCYFPNLQNRLNQTLITACLYPVLRTLSEQLYNFGNQPDTPLEIT